MNLKSRNKISPNFSMSSMTDIVFLLLIFFMLTSTMVSTNVLNLELPKADGAPAQEKQLIININNQGDFFIDTTPITKEAMEMELKQRFANKEQPSFILQAEDKTYTQDIVYIMDIANRNHYKMVLATAPNE